MKVRTLIELLKHEDPNLDVYFDDILYPPKERRVTSVTYKLSDNKLVLVNSKEDKE